MTTCASARGLKVLRMHGAGVSPTPPKLDEVSLNVCANLARVWSAFNPTFNTRLPGAHTCKFNFVINHAQILGGHARQEHAGNSTEQKAVTRAITTRGNCTQKRFRSSKFAIARATAFCLALSPAPASRGHPRLERG